MQMLHMKTKPHSRQNQRLEVSAWGEHLQHTSTFLFFPKKSLSSSLRLAHTSLNKWVFTCFYLCLFSLWTTPGSQAHLEVTEHRSQERVARPLLLRQALPLGVLAKGSGEVAKNAKHDDHRYCIHIVTSFSNLSRNKKIEKVTINKHLLTYNSITSMNLFFDILR